MDLKSKSIKDEKAKGRKNQLAETAETELYHNETFIIPVNSNSPDDKWPSVVFMNPRFFALRLTSIKIGFPQMPLDTAHNARQLTRCRRRELWINKSLCILPADV